MGFTRLQNAVLGLSLLAITGLVANTSAPVARAQSETTGAISGAVSDATGAVVPGATVTLIDTATNAKEVAKTNSVGRYTFSLLKPGTYKVYATAESLKSDTVQLSVILGTTVPGDVQVTPTGNNTVVEVTSNSLPLVDTQNVALATTFTEEQIQDLPTPGGDVTTVAFTAPGVAVNAGGEYGNFSANGLPGISNLFVLNGFDNQDPFLNLNNSGSSNLTLGQGELAEATVVLDGYNSQYGRAAGAVISYTTKSGGNKFHGLLDYNYNGTVLNANGWFNNLTDTARPHAVSNEWAANVGGPIIRDKVFFFADYEGLHYVLPASGYLTTPTTQFETYTQNLIASEGTTDDSVRRLRAHQLTPGQVSAAQAFAAQEFGLYDAATTKYNAQPLTTSDLGCGSLMDGMPAPGGGTFGTGTNAVPCMNQGYGGANNINKEWLFTGRVDWNVSDKQKIYGRYKMDRGSQPTYTSFINPLFDAVSIQPEYEGQFNDSYVITPNITNVFVAAANWYTAYFGPASDSASLAVYPFFGLTDLGYDGSGSAQSSGLSLLGVPDNLTQGRNVTQYQFEEDFNWIKGKHTIKLGANFRRDLIEDYDQRINTIFPTLAILDLYDFATGEIGSADNYPGFVGVNSFSQAFTAAPTAHLELYNLGTYVQDEFQALPNLKLTFGIRADRTGNPLCHQGCFSEYQAGSFGAATTATPYNFYDGGSISTQNWHPFPSIQAANIQPRFGFNYSFDQKTELRGGAGMFSDLYPAGFLDGVIQNYPNYNTVGITGGVVAASGSGNVQTSAINGNTVQQSDFLTGAGLATTNTDLLAQGIVASPPALGAYFNSEFKVPEYVEYSLQLQRELSKADSINITYAGNYGYNEFLANPLLNATTGAFDNGTGTWVPYAPPLAGVGTTPTNQNYSRITEFTSNAHSNYNALQISYKHNGHGFSGELNYTWAHSLDVISNGGQAGEPYNSSAVSAQLTPTLGYGTLNYSNSDYDIRKNMSGDLVYTEPYKFQNKIESAILGGWLASAKTYWRTGVPFSIENSQNGDYPDLGSAMMAQTAPGVSTGQLVDKATHDAHGCVYVPAGCLGDQTSANFQYYGGTGVSSLALQPTFGNVRRNALFGPHYADTDIALSKVFFKWESSSLKIGANAYNAFNKANFANPGSTIGDSNFGSITSVDAPPTSPYGSFQGAAVTQRVLQVFGKITF